MFISILISSVVAMASQNILYPVLMFPEPVAVNEVCLSHDGTSFETKNPINVCTQTVDLRYSCASWGEAESCKPLTGDEKPWPGEQLKVETKCVQYQKIKRKLKRVPVFKTYCVDLSYNGQGDTQYLECRALATSIGQYRIIFRYEYLDSEGGYQSGRYGILLIPECTD